MRLAAARFLSWCEKLDFVMSGSGGKRVIEDGREEMSVEEGWLPPLGEFQR